MRRWAVIALLLGGCGRAPVEATEVVVRVPSGRIVRPESKPYEDPIPPIIVFTPRPDTIPPRSPEPKPEPPKPAPGVQPEPALVNFPELRVESVEFPDAQRRSHHVIAFAAEADVAARAA